MRAVWIWERWMTVIAVLSLTIGTLSANAQDANRVQPQSTAEDVLASLVHHSAVIFAGEVYAIRVPQEMKSGTGVQGGVPSSRADAIEIEFRVDMGIRGTSIGNNYILHMPLSVWQQAPPFTLHQRAVTFLKPADASGFSGPVEGESDLPGMDLGVMPIDSSNQVDTSRLARMVSGKTISSPSSLPAPADPNQLPSVTDVATAQGEDVLVSGSNEGRMPELRNKTVPFLALVRDVSVLSAAENQLSNASAANPPAK